VHKPIVVAVSYSFNYLTKEVACFFFREISALLDVLQKLTTLKIFHYKHNLHGWKCVAGINLYDARVLQRLEHLSLSKYHVNITCIGDA
jgi:hypothetical protein